MQKLRTEVNDTYKWDLTKMYMSDDLINDDIELVNSLLEEFKKYEGNIFDNANNLLRVTKLNFEIGRILSNLITYASMRTHEDLGNDYYNVLLGKIKNLSQKVSVDTSFYEPEVMNADMDKFNSYAELVDELLEYKTFYDNIFRLKKHVLSLKEEKLISSLRKLFGTGSEISSLLRDLDMKFGFIIDEDNNEVELNNVNFMKYSKSNNRNVRKQAFFKLYEAYSGMTNTLSSAYKSSIQQSRAIANVRGYKSTRAMELYQSNVDEAIYDNLINTVNNRLDVLHRYYKLKKEKLNLDEMHMYDVYANLIDDVSEDYTFTEARDTVIAALSVLGDEYINDLKKAFDEKWIDIYPNKGKRSGAYSWGTYDSNPYILLNFQGDLSSVSTLAHELGHSMHSYYSHKNNPYQYAHYEIFVAEVASIVNELLLNNYLLNNTNDKKIKLNILNNMLELFRGTIFRQTMFAEFEYIIHSKAQNDEIITSDLLTSTYYDIVKKYFGSSVYVDEEIKHEWSRIPHFYNDFYVYQYATGLSAACYITSKILSNEDNYVSKYLDFLKSGGRDFPVELLKIADVDMNKEEVINSAIDMFEKTINEFEILEREQYE